MLKIVSREVDDERVVEAFRRVAREDFGPRAFEGEAYQDRPVPLPQRQTTSQPSLIARMVEAAVTGETRRVLEIGTGYGFQTALLAHLATEVVSIERHADLAEAARANLRDAGITNAEVFVGDGWEGWSERAPYDAIVVSAAAEEVPRALTEQLAEGGRLVIPVGNRTAQDLLLVTRQGPETRTQNLGPVRFVPLVGEQGWDADAGDELPPEE